MADNELKASSSDEDVSSSEESSSSGSEVSDSDSDQKQPTKSLPESSPITSKPQPPHPSSSESDDSEDSDSDSDSDSPPKTPVIPLPKTKPVTSKPMEPEPVKKTPPPTKRPAPATATKKDSKKPKTNNTANDDSKKQLFQRLWSEDDEIVILKGMIDYKTEKNGASPSSDMGAFHEFIKKSLHVDVSRGQLVDKIRRLKKKFLNNVGREKEGKDRLFSKDHDQKGYELSKLIWGSINGSKKNANNKPSSSTFVKSNGLDYKEASVMDIEKGVDLDRFISYDRSGGPISTEEIMKGGFELLEGRDRVEMEKKWKELKKMELELFVKRMDLLREQAVRILEAAERN